MCDFENDAKKQPTFVQDITLIRAKMPPLVRSGDAGTAAQQGARAIARDLLGKMSAPLDQPSLPFDDTWIQEIKVCVLQPFLRLFMYFTITIVRRFFESKLCVSL